MCIFSPYACLYTTHAWSSWKPEKGFRFPGIAVTDGHEQGAENQPRSSAEQPELLTGPSLQRLLLLLVPQAKLSVVFLDLIMVLTLAAVSFTFLKYARPLSDDIICFVC